MSTTLSTARTRIHCWSIRNGCHPTSVNGRTVICTPSHSTYANQSWMNWREWLHCNHSREYPCTHLKHSGYSVTTCLMSGVPGFPPASSTLAPPQSMRSNASTGLARDGAAVALAQPRVVAAFSGACGPLSLGKRPCIAHGLQASKVRQAHAR